MTKTITPPAPSPLLGSKQVAAQLGVSEATLSRWRTFKSGPAWINLGSLKSPIPRYAQGDLDMWVAQNRVAHA